MGLYFDVFSYIIMFFYIFSSMIKKTLLIINCLLLFTINFSWAQNIDVTVGNLSSDNYFIDYFHPVFLEAETAVKYIHKTAE